MTVEATPLLPFHPSHADYDHAVFALARYGAAFGGVVMRALDFAVLVWIAGQQPGIVHHQKTIGERFGLGHDAIHECLNRLRNRANRKTGETDGYGVPLIYSEAVKIKSRPLGPDTPRTQTKTNRYYLAPGLFELLEHEENARAQIAANKRAARAAEQLEAPPPPPPPTPLRQSRPASDLSWAEPEIQAIGAAFDALGLLTTRGEVRRALGANELQALRNRLGEGCTLDDLRAAVYGAEHQQWCRRDGTVWAVDPFAIIFKNTETVRKFARIGREAMGRDMKEAGPVVIEGDAPRAAAAPEGPQDVAGDEDEGVSGSPAPSGSAVEPSSMTASKPSSTGSERFVDQEPNSKTSTADGTEPSAGAAAPPAPNVASETPPSAHLARANAHGLAPCEPPSPREREAGQGDTQNRGQRPPAVTPSATAPASSPPAAQSRVVMLAGREVTITTSPTQVQRDQERWRMQTDMQAILSGMTPDFLRPGPNGERVFVSPRGKPRRR